MSYEKLPSDFIPEVRILKPRVRPDVAEVVQLLLESLLKWDRCDFPGASYTEDLNGAVSELRKGDVSIKYVERSEAVVDGVNVFFDDGTSYQLQVKRLA